VRDFRGLSLSSLGIGTYLGKEDEAADARYTEAIRAAIAGGVNVVDTAINYRSQRSERCVRAALAGGGIDREEILVATKGGFLPADGAATRDFARYVEETWVKPGILAPDEIVAGCQSFAPKYLADQLERSRNNLGLETIDVYYLHNPEMQLRVVTRSEFRKRMRAAFEVLEEAATAGRIGMYGTATWSGYRVAPEDKAHLSLAEMLDDAKSVGGERHRFRVVQLPYNLAMREAARLPTQEHMGRRVPFAEAALDQGLYVMTSASIHQGHLAQGHPPAVRAAFPEAASDAVRAIQFVRSTAGIGTALVGMGRPEHVAENLAVAAIAPAPPEVAQQLA
jgi:aryl-alcohol dehydrogenase-like predicted oxidoreductase